LPAPLYPHDTNSSFAPSVITSTIMGRPPKKRASLKTDGLDTDIIIPIMGPTGAGKSSFINIATGQDLTRVGHGLESCTADIQVIPIPHPNDPTRRIVFVDTPGFDDTYVSDADILKCIAEWLENSYRKDKRLSGIIYLYEISQKRMSGSSRKNYLMFGKLCGDEAARNIVLATSKWDMVKSDLGEDRERQLAVFWQDLIHHGSRMARFSGTHESAWRIIDSITVRDRVNDVLIQRELVDLMKFLPETQAGITLRLTLSELLEAQKKVAQDIQNGGNDEYARQLNADAGDLLWKISSQIQQLNVPLSKRIQRMFGLL